MKVFVFFLLAFLPLLAQPIVSVSIPPQSYFVQKIAGDSVELNELIPTGSDEHNFDFKPSTMTKLEKSDIYFTIGLEFEKIMLDKFKNLLTKLKVVDSAKGVRFIQSQAHHHEEEHEHHHHDEQEQMENDPHIWLDPLLVKIQARNIAEALSATYPQNAKLYAKNLQIFLKELDDLDSKIKKLLKDKKHKKFIVYHPSWAYFAARYDLIQVPVEIDGKEPKLKDLQELITFAKSENIKTIFVQKGFPQNAAALLAKETKASIVEIDHLSADYENELLKSAEKLAQN